MLETIRSKGWFSPVFPAVSAPLFAAQQTNTVVGEFLVEPPTLVSLGFDWKISGDDNRNARVDVSYRKVGETQWRSALPMLRLTTNPYQAERRAMVAAISLATWLPICFRAAF